jgi:predicted HNH restriction endonuclease
MTAGELALYKRGGAAALAAEAERQLAARTARSRRTAPRKAPGREAREATRAQHREETARLREALVVLADSKCERCGEWAPSDYGHMHHTRGGAGKRRQEQDITNVAWLCPECHGRMHAYPREARVFRLELAAKRSAAEAR